MYGLKAPAANPLGSTLGMGVPNVSLPSVNPGPVNTGLTGALAGAAPTMLALGAITSAYGAFAAARSTQIQLDLQADLALINARLSESSAQQSLIAGQRQVQAQRLKTAQLKGSQRAALAASGVDLQEGSAANILRTTDVMGEIDADTIEYNAVRAAWGYRTQRANSIAAATMARANADSANPLAAGTASLLGSAGSVAYNYARLKRGTD